MDEPITSFHSVPPSSENGRRDGQTDSPLSASGTSRQTRKLQLRNAGFRGPALPARKVTPKSVPSSNLSSTTGHVPSDAENVSPFSKVRSTPSGEKRVSSGILQEIGNSTVTRPKKSRPRLSSSTLFASNRAGDDAACLGDDLKSPPPPKAAIRPRSAKPKSKVSLRRRSVSAEASKYIEHLEMELAAAQSQLSSITSPSVTRQRSSKMRTLNAETRQLHEEIAEWGAKYEERVQEEVDRHCTVELELRTQIRSLEQHVEETRLKVSELEGQLEGATQSMQAVEAANVDSREADRDHVGSSGYFIHQDRPPLADSRPCEKTWPAKVNASSVSDSKLTEWITRDATAHTPRHLRCSLSPILARYFQSHRITASYHLTAPHSSQIQCPKSNLSSPKLPSVVIVSHQQRTSTHNQASTHGASLSFRATR